MPADSSWAERVCAAVVKEDRRFRGDGELVLRGVNALDEHRLEFRFVPSYLDGREVVLVIDGRRTFAEDFTVDQPDEAQLILEDWPIDEVAWRIFILGMHEPFGASELAPDPAGRWIRVMTS